jgi:cell division protein FtsQ
VESAGLSERRRARRGLPPAPKLDLPLLPGEDEPFLRPKARVRGRRVRRGPSHASLLALQIGGGVLAVAITLWAGYAQVLASDRLKVKRVTVRGNHFLSEGEIRGLLGVGEEANILGLDIEELKQRLRASPWLEDATVRRTLPDALQVEVREREPLALAEVERLYLMDAQGELIDLYGARTAGFDLPILRGLQGLDAEQRSARAQRAATLLADLGDLQAEVSEIEVEPQGDLRVVLRQGGEVLRLDQPPYRKSVAAFLALRQELVERCPRAEYFDLRFKDRIYAKEPPELAHPQPQAAREAGSTPAQRAGGPGDAAQERSSSGERGRTQSGRR